MEVDEQQIDLEEGINMDEEWGITFKEEKNLWKEYISQLLLSPRICPT